jgi:putative FmdB family regulatory protein
MPLYEYLCRDCKQVTEDYRSVEKRNDAPVCECGGQTEKIVSGYRVHPDMEPYYDDNLETYITGRQHRQQVMREKGVIEGYGKGWDVSRRRSRH